MLTERDKQFFGARRSHSVLSKSCSPMIESEYLHQPLTCLSTLPRSLVVRHDNNEYAYAGQLDIWEQWSKADKLVWGRENQGTLQALTASRTLHSSSIHVKVPRLMAIVSHYYRRRLDLINGIELIATGQN